jgi:hypothetical protein
MDTQDYIPENVGLTEGDAGADVSRLQRYLSMFGYLESPALEVFGVPQERAIAPAPTDTGQFDENTAKALKASSSAIICR